MLYDNVIMNFIREGIRYIESCIQAYASCGELSTVVYFEQERRFCYYA
jgi:hypothetical protein